MWFGKYLSMMGSWNVQFMLYTGNLRTIFPSVGMGRMVCRSINGKSIIIIDINFNFDSGALLYIILLYRLEDKINL